LGLSERGRELMSLRRFLGPARAIVSDPGLALGILWAGISLRREYVRHPLPELLDRISSKRSLREGRRLEPKEIARQVDRLSPTLIDPDWGPCFGRALLLFQFLWRCRYRAQIHFGVLTDPREPLRGHAWVSLDGVPVGERIDPRGRYKETYCYPEA